MKLNTEKLFISSSLKSTPKTKYKNSQKANINSNALTSNKKTKNKVKTNSKTKQKLFPKSNKKINPFTQSTGKKLCSKFVNPVKKRNSEKILIFKFNEEEEEKNDLFDDSYSRNIMLTCDSKINKSSNKRKIIKRINTANSNENRLKLEKVGNLYKKSNLKATIIIDGNGNNNLDLEQKNLIKNYFNKKTNESEKPKNFLRSNFRKIPTQIYNDNNNIFNKIFHLKSSTIDTSDRTNGTTNKLNKFLNKNHLTSKNISTKIKDNDKNEDNNIKIKNKSKFANFKTTCLLINDLLVKDKSNLSPEKENKKKIEEDSVFEASLNLSFDSSFLGSSFDNDFYQNLNKK
jgi:hypothetical protein